MEKIVVYTNPKSPITEAYRVLCTNILAGLGDKKLVEVVGVATSMYASLVTANLATAMAQANKNVLLIDCNLRSPKQHTLFGLTNRGITDCFSKAGNLADFAQQTLQQNLYVVTAGSAMLNPVEILLSVTIDNLLREATAAYDIVLLDVPAVVEVADAAALGTKSDGVLLVLTNKVDKVEQAQKTKQIFTQAGVPILGCVLDKT